MTLVSILCAWLLIRCTSLQKQIQQLSWFDNYLVRIVPYLQKLTTRAEAQFVFLLTIPLLLAWLVLLLFTHIGGHLGLTIFSIIILTCCWAESSFTVIAAAVPTRTIFSQALHHAFALLFWFAVLGPLGALLYNLLRHSQKTFYAPFTITLQQMMDWPAARLLGFGYALAGHFHPAFTYWFSHLFSDAKHSALFLEECGLLALNSNLDEVASTSESTLKMAKALVKRAQIMLLIALALFTLGSWLY